jgi:hypothetical protein
MTGIFLYDNDPSGWHQGENISFPRRRRRTAQRLDDIGITIEGGWPGSNPRICSSSIWHDIEFTSLPYGFQRHLKPGIFRRRTDRSAAGQQDQNRDPGWKIMGLVERQATPWRKISIYFGIRWLLKERDLRSFTTPSTFSTASGRIPVCGRNYCGRKTGRR